MTIPFMRAVDERTVSAKASGALQPIRAEHAEITEAGLRFVVRWVSSLAAKDEATLPGGPRDPDFNPFLPPEPALTVAPLGEQHVAILNKFPVCEHHLVIARRDFEEQLAPLALSDFTALALIMSESGGLGFCNGGAPAGASQRHLHVQWIPAAASNASMGLLAPGLPGDIVEHGAATHPALPIRHCFVRAISGRGTAVETSARSMHRAFDIACAKLHVQPGEDGLLPAYNMLVGDGWLLVVPRSQEHFEDISINALSYGGTFYVRGPQQLDVIREVGPLRVLAAVGC